MLWRPATPGEEVFLTLYSVAGKHIDISVPEPNTLDFLVSESSFREFARLVATLELFHRAGVRWIRSSASRSTAARLNLSGTYDPSAHIGKRSR